MTSLTREETEEFTHPAPQKRGGGALGNLCPTPIISTFHGSVQRDIPLGNGGGNPGETIPSGHCVSGKVWSQEEAYPPIRIISTFFIC